MDKQKMNSLAEEFIKFLNDNGGDVHLKDLLPKFKEDEDEPEILQKLQTQLMKEGYLDVHGKNFQRYALTRSGREFKSYADEEIKRQLKEEEKELDLKIKNMTVSNHETQKLNTKLQQKIARAALLISFFSLLISLFSSLNSYLSSQNRKEITIEEWQKLLDAQTAKIEQAIRERRGSEANNIK